MRKVGRELRKGEGSPPRKEHPRVTLMWPCPSLRKKLGLGGISGVKE